LSTKSGDSHTYLGYIKLSKEIMNEAGKSALTYSRNEWCKSYMFINSKFLDS